MAIQQSIRMEGDEVKPDVQAQEQAAEQPRPKMVNARDFAAILNKPKEPAADAPAAQAEPANEGLKEEHRETGDTTGDKSIVSEQKQDAPPTTVQDWKELIKDIPIKELLAAKNVDGKIAGIYDHWEAKGNIDDYVKDLSTDYSKMSAVDLMRLKIEKEYSGIEDPADKKLLLDEALSNYKLNPDDGYSESEVRLANLKLDNDVKSFREQLVKEQSERRVPTIDPQNDLKAQMEVQKQQQEANVKAYSDYVTGNEATKTLLANKKITIGEGADAYNIKIDDAQGVVDMALDYSKYNQMMADEKGLPDMKRILLIRSISKNPEKALADAIEHGKKLGVKSLNREIDHQRDNRNQTSNDSKSGDIYERMARNGVVVRN